MKNTFSLDEKKEYLIYGAGGGGLKLVPVFKKRGYCLKGFIDKRADSLREVCGKKVWNLDTLSELQGEAENIVIIITIKNVFEHTNIAEELKKIGFDQCVYKPLSILQGYEDVELKKISKAHDAFLINIEIPDVQILSKVEKDYEIVLKDSFFISSQQKNIVAWLPLELLFNYKDSDVYAQMSMATYFPLKNLYKMFLGEKVSNESEILEDFFCYCNEWAYRNNIAVTQELRQRWIESRYEAFTQMQEIADYDFDFFCRSAPEVERNINGSFNLVCSGRNRVVFLEAKGYRHIPVKMSDDNYQKWINKNVMDEVIQYMKKYNIRKTYAPVSHPYFKNFQARHVDYYRLVCFPIAEYIIQWIYREARKIIDDERNYITDSVQLEKLKKECLILCDLEDEGACSRYLKMCGFSVIRKTKADTLGGLFDKLLYQDVCEWETQKVKVVIADKIHSNDNWDAEKMIYIVKGTGSFRDSYELETVLSRIFEVDGIRAVNVYKRREDG